MSRLFGLYHPMNGPKALRKLYRRLTRPGKPGAFTGFLPLIRDYL
jgi:hypothetical protein